MLELCLEIEKKMKRFYDEFKVAMFEINGKLEIVQLQVNHLWNCAFANYDSSTVHVPASTSIVPASSLMPDSAIDILNVTPMHIPLPNNPSQTHTDLIHSLLSRGTIDFTQNLVGMDQDHV